MFSDFVIRFVYEKFNRRFTYVSLRTYYVPQGCPEPARRLEPPRQGVVVAGILEYRQDDVGRRIGLQRARPVHVVRQRDRGLQGVRFQATSAVGTLIMIAFLSLVASL